MMTADTNGRATNGRFAKGNAGGPGNPLGGKVARLRAAILAAVTPEDIDAIVRAMVQRAKGGDMAATKELLYRAIGKPTDGDLSERLEALEQLAERLNAEAAQ
ncbi:MAG: hypothetical protein AB8F26_05475 [Phycisphaerales bacterium]